MSPSPHLVALALLGLALAARPASAEDRKPSTAPLITRGRIQLNLAGAETVLAAARRKAEALGLKANIAIVDDGGQLLSFARMDGARPASASTALTKAVSAATFRQETGALPAKGEPDLLLSLSIQGAALASGGKITTLKGGVPIVIDGQVVGAVGVGGGTGEQDVEVARAGIQALLDELREKK
jgi:glc operon protein GlcG